MKIPIIKEIESVVQNFPAGSSKHSRNNIEDNILLLTCKTISVLKNKIYENIKKETTPISCKLL